MTDDKLKLLPVQEQALAEFLEGHPLTQASPTGRLIGDPHEELRKRLQHFPMAEPDDAPEVLQAEVVRTTSRPRVRSVLLVGDSTSRGLALHLMIELLASNVGQIVSIEEHPHPRPKKLEPFVHDEYWDPPLDPIYIDKLQAEPEEPPRAFKRGSFFPPETVAKDKRGYNRPRRR